MTKLALAVAAAALAFVATPASAGHRSHHSSHAHVHHVHAHHSHYSHHTHAHAYKPVHHGYRHGHGHSYSAPTYVKPHVTAYAPTNCFWQVQKYGYEHRKVWVCPQAQYKSVEHVKPAVKVVEAAPAPAHEPAPAPEAPQ